VTLLDRFVDFDPDWRQEFIEVLFVSCALLGVIGFAVSTSAILFHVNGLLVRIPQISLARLTRLLGIVAATVGLLWVSGFAFLLLAPPPFVFSSTATTTITSTSQGATTYVVVGPPTATARTPIAPARPVFATWYLVLNLLMAVASLLLVVGVIAFPILTLLVALSLRRAQREAAAAPFASVEQSAS
jgi:hypothetical protein